MSFFSNRDRVSKVTAQFLSTSFDVSLISLYSDRLLPSLHHIFKFVHINRKG